MLKTCTITLILCVCILASAQGANLIREPGAERTISIADYPAADCLTTRCPDKFYAPGWGVYNGGCAMSWGVTAAESRAGDRAVFMRIINPQRYGGKFFYSGALLLGEGDGYSGVNALELKPDTRYKFAVWLKTSAPHDVTVSISVYARRRGKDERRALPIASLLVDDNMVLPEQGRYLIKADCHWRRVEGVFASDGDTETANVCFGLARTFDRIEEFSSIALFMDDAEVTAQ